MAECRDHRRGGSSSAYTPSCCDTEATPSAPEYPITVLRNIPYWDGPDATHRHQLDIYFSAEAIARHREACARQADDHTGVPVTIHVHGGGWQRGDRANEWRGGPNAGRAIARHGMIGVCPSYRLAPPSVLGLLFWATVLSILLPSIASLFSAWVWDALPYRCMQLFGLICTAGVARALYGRNNSSHPEPALDVCRVVKWTREHLREHVQLADVDRVFLSGHSAGGHLVSLVSLDPRYYRTVGLRDTSFVRGVCSVSGVYTLWGPLHRNPRALKNRLFRLVYGGTAFGYKRAALVDASPITHVHAQAPPFLLMSATSDLGLEVDAEAFAARLGEVGVPFEYHIVQKTSHSTIASRFEKHAAHRHLFQFIDKCCEGTSQETKKTIQ